MAENALLRVAEQSVAERPANAPEEYDASGRRRDARRMAIETGRMWSAGRVLRLGFLGGDPAVWAKVATIAQEWTRHARITFEVVDDPHVAEVRIAFDPGAAWSLIGTEALGVRADAATMNLGRLTSKSPDDLYRRVVLHEFGHTLGCVHEHSSPKAGIPWDLRAVYQYYARPPNTWTPEQVDLNVIKKYSVSQTRSTEFDPASIMIYPIPGALTGGKYSVDWNVALSDLDRSFIGQHYPLTDPAALLLECDGEPVEAIIDRPGEVGLFVFEVHEPGDYVLGTSGFTDLGLRVYGPGGAVAALADVEDGGPGGNSRVELPLMPGSYRVEVRHRRPNGTGAYALAFQHVSGR
ncbi:zinc metalloprotease [Kribbella monticola]|uniref:hypothetical protein n=1 Tax=Kribbella monticola TaxID=2185285 RepID=UPI000DD37824|nr:hypothetical protein [Kribbella monticola]